MNFLSHLYLSGNAEGLIIGNFIADSVKGNTIKSFPLEIQKGIILHRQIDAYTDSHSIVEESKQRLRGKYKKYASVIVDIYYDHFLAINWEEYSQESLDEYTKNIYIIIEKHRHSFPLKSQLFTKYMLEHNILSAYAKLEGIDSVLQGMSKRTSFISNMEHAIHDLKEHYSVFEKEFKLFFPELQKYVNTKIDI